MAKLYFDGGDYNIPLQEMDAGQTVEVDIKKLRDDQVPDVLGHLIPLSVTGGQLDWGPRAHRGEFIGRLVQYSPSGAMASSFSCVGACLCDNSFGSAVIYPGLFSGFIGDTFGLQSTETDVDCNQQVVYTYNVGPTQGLQYSSSDSTVVTINNGTATLVGFGQAEITASWDTFNVTQHCFYSAEGDCVDATCNSRPVPNPIVIGDAVVVPVKFTRVVTDYDVEDFVPGISGNTFTADMSLSSDTPICSGSAFNMIVRLRKDNNATLYSPQDTRNIVDTADDSQYRVNGGGLQSGTSNDREFDIRLQRIHPNNPNRYIRIKVAGYSDQGDFSATAYVTIICP